MRHYPIVFAPPLTGVLLLFFTCSWLAAEPINGFEQCQLEQHGTAFYGAQCAQLEVPTANSTRTAKLNILRAQARSAPKSAPLIVITGGPGTSAVGQAWQYLRFFGRIQKDRDIVFIDQRGTGKSQPLLCVEAQEIADNAHTPKQLVVFKEALKACISQYPYLNELSSAQAARDIDAVRDLLGYQQVNLWGSSYGTRVAMAYQALFPTNTRTVILDGVAPAAMALPRHAEHDASLALDTLFTECEAAPSCSNRFATLRQTWANLLDSLEQSTAQVVVTHPRTGQKSTIGITPDIAANWVRFGLYSRELAALLPIAIEHASQGDFSSLSHLAMTAQDGLQGHLAYGMHVALLCHEDFHAPKALDPSPFIAIDIEAANTESRKPSLPFARLNDLSDICLSLSELPVSDRPSYEPISSSAPTLLLSGALDPATPPYWAEWSRTNMPNSRHWVLPGGHHGVSGVGCMPEQLAIFVSTASINALDHACHKDYSTTPFFVDYAGPSLTPTQSAASSASNKENAQ